MKTSTIITLAVSGTIGFGFFVIQEANKAAGPSRFTNPNEQYEAARAALAAASATGDAIVAEKMKTDAEEQAKKDAILFPHKTEDTAPNSQKPVPLEE